jgi:hypothetical protein
MKRSSEIDASRSSPKNMPTAGNPHQFSQTDVRRRRLATSRRAGDHQCAGRFRNEPTKLLKYFVV